MGFGGCVAGWKRVSTGARWTTDLFAKAVELCLVGSVEGSGVAARLFKGSYGLVSLDSVLVLTVVRMVRLVMS